MGNNPFSGCTELTSIYVPPENSCFAVIDNVLFEKNSKRLIIYPEGLTSSLYTVPDGVLEIGDSAFYYCRSLSSVSLPDSLQSIGDEAFFGCETLSSISLPNGLQSIGDKAFGSCFSLSCISLPDSLQTIGKDAFSGYSPSLTVPLNSYAAQYCMDNGLDYTYPDANDRLNS